jgi:hypothetical protein
VGLILRESLIAMRRQWLRLVVCVNLATFLVANTHAGTVLARRLLTPSSTRHIEHRCEHFHDCDHQQSDGGHTAPDADADEPRSLCCPDCPDCPKGPIHSRCPCPGGCAMCSLAKVLHSAAGICLTCPADCFETRLPDPSLTYSSPFAGRLIRPPRA